MHWFEAQKINQRLNRRRSATLRTIVDRLCLDLLNRRVSCWHYRYDSLGGDFFGKQIKAAIKNHEKLIVISSKKSLVRQKVIEEIIEAIEDERIAKTQKLHPIRLDNFVLSKTMDKAYEAL